MKLDSNIQYVLPNTAMGWEVKSAPTPMRRAISAFANYGATVTGTVKATASGHGLATGDIVTISGTTSYNETFEITKISSSEFYFTDTWVANDGSSILQKVGVITLGRADVKVILYTNLKYYYRFSATQPSASNGQLVATTDLFVANTTEKELYVLMIPEDPDDERNIYLEIRAGTGGDEAAQLVKAILGLPPEVVKSVKRAYGGK